MLKKFPSLLLLFSLILIGCDDKEKSEMLAKREQELLEKEKIFAKKELDYKNLLRMRDSIFAKKDSQIVVQQWPADIVGDWNGKVICTESNCSDYVIGDQRTDVWQFSSDSIQLVSKIINNNNLVRVYNAKMSNGDVNLTYRSDSTSQKKVEMNVLLNEFGDKKIRGVRTITVDNNCTAKFSVELTRPKN
jgi:asparagine N-glycosylation enzyme membrane subunit Stt3